MKIENCDVGLLPCHCYERSNVKQCIASIAGSMDLRICRGDKVLLKPNLVIGRRQDGLPCTHAEFIAGVVEWFLDLGVQITVGDSPAFGTAKGVMASCGITEALKSYPVRLCNFDESVGIKLRSGFTVKIARPALECDILISLPKLKAHSQLLITLAVKNYFGAVTGFRKAALHARLGEKESLFAACIVDLLEVLPGGASFIDGITAMHEHGPASGRAFELGIIGGAVNPLALDTALLKVLGIDPERSLLWKECHRRNLPGSRFEDLRFTHSQPKEFLVNGFRVPDQLKPISFHPFRLLVSGIKRARERFFPRKRSES